MELPAIVSANLWELLTLLILAALVLLLLAKTLRYIPNNRVGIVEKLVSGRGSVKSGLIALDGEAGFQPQVLRGGWHFFMPFMYRIHKVPLVTIPQGKIGYVFARDGQDLPPAQTLASNATGERFPGRDGASSQAGGQKGPQRHDPAGGHLRHQPGPVRGAHRGPALLPAPGPERSGHLPRRWRAVIAERGGFRPVIIRGTDDAVGIVTVHDGPSLPRARSSPPPWARTSTKAATYHNNFQDADKFLPGRRLARPAVPGAGGRHLLHQPPVRHRGADPQDRGGSGQRGRGGDLHRRGGPGPQRRRITATANWWPRAARASGPNRCCPASTPSTPTPARCCWCPPPTSS